MNDAPGNPYAEMIALGRRWAEAMNPSTESFTPKGFEAVWPTMPKDLMEIFMGRTFNPEGLDAKTRLLLTLHGLTILGARGESQMRLTVRHAIEAGATAQEVAETVAMAGAFGGVPAMTRAMDLVREAVEPRAEGGE